VALAHTSEAIHPFLDGNGRVGRLLITLFLVERGILPTPLLYLSAFFEATRRDYYDRLFGVSTRGEWSVWLEYFLNGAARQAEDALSRAERISGLLVKWRQAVSGAASGTPWRWWTCSRRILPHDQARRQATRRGFHNRTARN
jgi:hypothetical protein